MRRSGDRRYTRLAPSSTLNRFQKRPADRRVMIEVERNGALFAHEPAGEVVNDLQ
jgi:hypothetical protein